MSFLFDFPIVFFVPETHTNILEKETVCSLIKLNSLIQLIKA